MSSKTVKSKKVEDRKGIAPYLYHHYKNSSIRSLIVKQYGRMLLIKLASARYTVMHEQGLGNPEVEVIYKDEIEDKLPRYFFSKLEAKAYIIDICSGKNHDFLI